MSLSTLQIKQRRAILQDLELERALEKNLCLDSLYHFVKSAWHVIEPGVPFVDGWHIQAICLHLEKLSEFDITKLIINMPPRHMKSILCGVMWPAWVWLKHPERRFLYASYSMALATRDSLKTRTLIESQWYQDTFKPTWQLKDDSNQKTLFENTSQGSRQCVGVGGGVTGMGGDHLVEDDPINAMDALSDPAMDYANTWHDIAFSTRYNNPQRHTKLIVMQRLGENDVTGHVLEKGDKWDRLVLPARFNPDADVKSKTAVGWVDPRKVKGELLWPARFNEASLDDLEDDLNRHGGAGDAQLQQDPKPRKGGVFPRENWQYYIASPSQILSTVQFWDCAQKPGVSNDYSVCATWAQTLNGFYLLDLYREKTDATLLEEMAKQLAERWRPNAVVIEDKSAGSSLIQYLLRYTTLPVLPYNPGQRDKVVRALAATPTVKAKKCFLPKSAKFVQDFIKEHETFPKAKHDDQVDTTAMAIEYFLNLSSSTGPRIRQL